MKRIAVIQHTSADYLGLMEDHLEGRRIRFRYFRPFTEKGKVPTEEELQDGLILLGGGPWGSAGGRDVPTRDEEIARVRYCLAKGLPVLGIGLGAQLLAIAAGGASEPSPLAFEVGRGHRVDTEALNGYLPETFPLVSYMRDRPVLPEGARVLAVDDGRRPAIFQIGASAFGFTGHPGIKVAMIEDLIMEFEEGPADPGPGLEQVRNLKREIEDALIPIMTGLVQLTRLMQNQ